MRNALIKYSLKALALTLMLSIVATGAFAIHLTHINASVTITFGEQLPVVKQVALANVVDTSQLQPLPVPTHRGH